MWPATAIFNQHRSKIAINYNQGSKSGRAILREESEGAWQPYGKYCGSGTNPDIVTTFDRDLTFYGTELSAGTYRMYAVPDSEHLE